VSVRAHLIFFAQTSPREAEGKCAVSPSVFCFAKSSSLVRGSRDKDCNKHYYKRKGVYLAPAAKKNDNNCTNKIPIFVGVGVKRRPTRNNIMCTNFTAGGRGRRPRRPKEKHYRLCEQAPSTANAVPLPQWGGLVCANDIRLLPGGSCRAYARLRESAV